MATNNPERWNQALANAPTTGASAQTAKQDHLRPGIDSSRKMAETDLSRVQAIAETPLSRSEGRGRRTE
jgi:hypothetical protein